MNFRAFVLALGTASCAAACCNNGDFKKVAEPIVSSEPAPEALPARCKLLGQESSVGQVNATSGDNSDDIVPFAAQVSDGVAFEDGFALGALRPNGKGGTEAVVVVGSKGGSGWRTVRLADSHGDAEPPSVFARGKLLGAAMLEPAGAKRTLRLAKIEGEAVQWGAEILEGQKDESMAFSVALGERRGVAVWDEDSKEKKTSVIYLSSFKPETLSDATTPRTMTLPGTDAEAPQLVTRPGGFWLFWIARRPANSDPEAQYQAEDIPFKWLEAVPLDADGALSGAPRRISAENGNVAAYDLIAGPDGTALAVWRDTDTPSGSSGGQVMRAVVRLGGIDGPDVVDAANVGIGVPHLMPGWFSVADASGPTRLTPMGSEGKLLDVLRSEELLGMGEPLASHGDNLLVSRPAGQGVRVFVANCSRSVIDAGAPDASIDPSPDDSR